MQPDSGGYRRDRLGAPAQCVEVTERPTRITASKGELLSPLAATPA